MTRPSGDRPGAPSAGDRARGELERELRFHFEETVAALRRQGLEEREARREAARRFGDEDDWRSRIVGADLAPLTLRARLARATGQVRGALAAAGRDVRSGIRALVRTPLFTCSGAAVFALVAAAVTVAFAMAGGVLLRPLPYPDADRLVYIWGRNPGVHAGFVDLPVSEPELADWRAAEAFEAVGGVVPDALTLTGGGIPERVAAAAVLGRLFEALDVRPLLGRTLADEDGRAGARPVVVLGYDLWQRRLAGDPGAVGRTIVLDDVPREIVGVMPPGFSFPRVAEISSHYGFEAGIEAYVPWTSGAAGPVVRGNRYLVAVARLKAPGDPARAEREVNALTAEALGGDAGDQSFAVVPFGRQAVAGVRTSLVLLVGAVGVLVGIGALNLTHLLLVRVGDRRQQFAIRAALGAGRAALVRQVVVEAVLLAAAGGIAGLVSAAGMLRVVRRLAPADFPRLDAVRLDAGVVAAAFAALGLCALVVGLGAALGLRRTTLEQGIRGASRGNSGAGRSGRWLVGVEVALSALLLVVGGLLGRSLWRVSITDPGFDARRVLTFQVTLPPVRYPSGADVRRGFESIRDGLARRPGVEGAAFTWQLPMTGVEASASYTREDGQNAMALVHRVSPEYFRVMGMRLVRGCGFECAADLPPVVLNQAAVRRQWPDRDAIGAVVTVNGARSRITGIVSDVRHGSLEEPPAPELYTATVLRTMFFVARGAPGADLEAMCRDAVASVDPGVPLADVRHLTERLEASAARRRFTAAGLGVFATASLLLALVGLYGVTALVAARRRPEMAIRLALGARPGGAVALIVRQHGLVIAAGLAAGVTAGFTIALALTPVLYETRPWEPAVYAGVVAMMAAAGLLASAVPARRVSRVDPIEALRGD